jgi:hypothetical protein
MKEALKLALEALHGFIPYLPLNNKEQCEKYDKAITAIKAALAQQEGQSNFCAQCEAFARELKAVKQAALAQPPTYFYTTPQQRPWVGLTEAQFLKAALLAETGNYLVAFKRIQEWLKEKNNG